MSKSIFESGKQIASEAVKASVVTLQAGTAVISSVAGNTVPIVDNSGAIFVEATGALLDTAQAYRANNLQELLVENEKSKALSKMNLVVTKKLMADEAFQAKYQAQVEADLLADLLDEPVTTYSTSSANPFAS